MINAKEAKERAMEVCNWDNPTVWHAIIRSVNKGQLWVTWTVKDTEYDATVDELNSQGYVVLVDETMPLELIITWDNPVE